MGLGRTAPHRTRGAYAAALAQIPLPVRAISAPIDQALTVLGTTEIGGRTVQFGTLTEAPRLWVAFPEATRPVFGYLTGLPSGSPLLQVTDQSHLAWTRAGDHTEPLKRTGLEAWRTAQRWCEG
ncbi:hypothetical protein [Glycomyces salinus]|uniref:hypothetical protein n=1 Tax=Glycomyces salinus TaxID=980294 RepID=UPI0018ED2F3B|nr:hypothetical protein [Glycomyces salinus]